MKRYNKDILRCEQYIIDSVETCNAKCEYKNSDSEPIASPFMLQFMDG